MKISVSSPILGCLSALFLAPLAVKAQSFVYDNFSDTTGLQINADATTTTTGDGTVLRLTPAEGGQAGSAFSTTEIALADNASFSTEFAFRITDVGGIHAADGITFTVQTQNSTAGGGGGGLGYAGISPSLAVEFDTFENGGADSDDNHVAVDTDGNAYQDSDLTDPSTLLADGDLWYAWINYNGATDDLTVYASDGSSVLPATPLINTTAFNLVGILGQSSAYVGFTAGTGAGWENQDIKSWQFNDSYSPITTIGGGGVPDTPTTALLFAAALAGLGIYGRSRRSCRAVG
jgi:hypothetical protein